MNKLPIEEFADQEELQICAEYWKDKLRLNDWFISFELVDGSIEDNYSGMNYCNNINRFASIEIAKLDNEHSFKIQPVRRIAEVDLVHELLHCIYHTGSSSYEIEDSSFKTKAFDEVEHAKLEAMAKTLIMVKYNLDYNYFCNVR